MALSVAVHRALAAAGLANLAYLFVFAILLVEAATVFLVLRPIRLLARDARRIARATWSTASSGAAATASA